MTRTDLNLLLGQLLTFLCIIPYTEAIKTLPLNIQETKKCCCDWPNDTTNFTKYSAILILIVDVDKQINEQ